SSQCSSPHTSRGLGSCRPHLAILVEEDRDVTASLEHLASLLVRESLPDAPVPEADPAIVAVVTPDRTVAVPDCDGIQPCRRAGDVREDAGGVEQPLTPDPPDPAEVRGVLDPDLSGDLVRPLGGVDELGGDGVPVLDVEQIDFGHARASLSASVTSSPANARSSSDVCLCACRYASNVTASELSSACRTRSAYPFALAQCSSDAARSLRWNRCARLLMLPASLPTRCASG